MQLAYELPHKLLVRSSSLPPRFWCRYAGFRQSYLLGLKLGYQLGLGLLDLDYGLLADLHTRFDCLRAPLHLLG